MLVENGQVRKVVCSFTAATRPTDVLPFARFHELGEVEAELVPQGTLAERLRAAGSGIPAFYTPTGVGTEIAEGKRDSRLQRARPTCWSTRCPSTTPSCAPGRPTRPGNLRFRLAQRNFNPIMAMAARTVIVEVEEELLPVGAHRPGPDPHAGHLVHRMVNIPPPPEGLWPARRVERAR